MQTAVDQEPWPDYMPWHSSTMVGPVQVLQPLITQQPNLAILHNIVVSLSYFTNTSSIAEVESNSDLMDYLISRDNITKLDVLLQQWVIC